MSDEPGRPQDRQRAAGHPQLQAASERIGQGPGTYLALGGTDTGKTTFCWQLARVLLARGLRTAIVDADLGQSDIGPPATVGWAWYEEDLEAARPVRAEELYFVGAVSPVGHVLGVVVGAVRMLSAAHSAGADAVIIDTCGLVDGDIARELKTALMEATLPDVVVAVARGTELDHIVNPWRRGAPFRVERVVAPQRLATKAHGLRRRRRQTAFAEYFDGAQVREIDLSSCAVHGCLPGRGEPLPGTLKALAESALQARVLSAEQTDTEALFVTDRPVPPSRVRELQQQLPEDQVAVVSRGSIESCLGAIVDDTGRHAGLCLLQRLDGSNGVLEVLAPPSVAPPAAIVLGSIRLSPDGAQLADGS